MSVLHLTQSGVNLDLIVFRKVSANTGELDEHSGTERSYYSMGEHS
jgi:hypothetical protein